MNSTLGFSGSVCIVSLQDVVKMFGCFSFVLKFKNFFKNKDIIRASLPGSVGGCRGVGIGTTL